MKQVTNDIRKDILVSLKDEDKRQNEIRKDCGISQENRSSLKYHLDKLMGKKNGAFEDNPLVEEYREDGVEYYTTNGNQIDYRFNTEYFLPYIYLAVLQMLAASVIFYQGYTQVFLGYIVSTFITTIIVSGYVAFREDIREVYYADEEPTRSTSSISDVISNTYN